MIRSAAAVLFGYLAAAVVIMVLFQFAFWRQELTAGPGLLVLNATFGLLGGLAGGYLAGVIAGGRAVAHGLALAGFGALVGGVSAIVAESAEARGYELASIAGIAAGAVMGAWLGGRGVQRRRAAMQERLSRLLGSDETGG